MSILNLPERNNIGVVLLLGFIWGTSFILIKKGLLFLSPFEVACLRVATGGIVLWPVAFTVFKDIEKKYLPKLLISGLLGTLLPGTLFAIAGTQLNSAASGSLNALTPVFTLLIGVVLYRTQVKWLQIVGVIFGFLGAVVLAASKGGWQNLLEINSFALLVVLATLMYGINIHITKRWFATIDPKIVSVGTTCQVGIIGLIYLVSNGHFRSLITSGSLEALNSVWFIMLLGAFSTGFANLLFMKLIKESSPVFASSTTYIIPIFSVLWGLLDHEVLAFSHYCGMVAILAGVLMVNKSQ